MTQTVVPNHWRGLTHLFISQPNSSPTADDWRVFAEAFGPLGFTQMWGLYGVPDVGLIRCGYNTRVRASTFDFQSEVSTGMSGDVYVIICNSTPPFPTLGVGETNRDGRALYQTVYASDHQPSQGNRRHSEYPFPQPSTARYTESRSRLLLLVLQQ